MIVSRSLILFVMENSLQLLMSQAVRYLKEPTLSARDKQLLKRELSAELVSFFFRHINPVSSEKVCDTINGRVK